MRLSARLGSDDRRDELGFHGVPGLETREARHPFESRPCCGGLEGEGTQRHKLTLDLLSGAGEMYDLQEDPTEMHNLFGDAGRAAVQRELADMIHSRAADACAPLPQVGMA
jgi:Domain of unknown function (DUF4976)